MRTKSVWRGDRRSFNLLVAGSAALATLRPGDLWSAAESAASSWPLFRGDPLATGVARGTLPADLAVRWRFTVPNGSFDATPAIVDGVVYIGDLDGTVYAIDLQSGAKKWEHKTESGFAASPAVRDGRIIVGDLDGRITCLNTMGEVVWTFETDAEIDGGANFYGDNIVVGSQDATLYCLEAAAGKLVWKHQIADQIRCMPTVVEDRCFVAGCDGKFHIIDLTNGSEAAAVEIGAPTGVTPAVLGDRVYFGTEAGTFFCIDWRKAEIAWTFEEEKKGQSLRSSPAVAEDIVVFGSRARRVYAFHPGDGKPLWKFPVKQRVDSSPVIVGDRVFVAVADGRLHAIDRKTGEKKWEEEFGGSFGGSPAVAEEHLVIGNSDGTLYALGAKRSD